MNDTSNQFPTPAVPGAADAERLNGLRTLTHVLYGLYAIHWLTGASRASSRSSSTT